MNAVSFSTIRRKVHHSFWKQVMRMWKIKEAADFSYSLKKKKITAPPLPKVKKIKMPTNLRLFLNILFIVLNINLSGHPMVTTLPNIWFSILRAHLVGKDSCPEDTLHGKFPLLAEILLHGGNRKEDPNLSRRKWECTFP